MCCTYCKKKLNKNEICFCYFSDSVYDDWGKLL